VKRGATALSTLLALLACACDAALVPTKALERRREAATLAATLARTLEALPGVDHARVQLVLPVTPDFASTLAPAAQASVLLSVQSGSAQVDAAAVRRLVAGAVAGLPPEAVVLEQTPSRAPAPKLPELTRVGPFTVTRASASLLRTTLASALALQVLLASAVIFLLERARRKGPPPS
jgi:type III secretory pathway lipoprotein EscJ